MSRSTANANEEEVLTTAREWDLEELETHLNMHLRLPSDVKRDLRKSNDFVEIGGLEGSEGVSSSVVSEVVPILPE